VAVAGRFLAQEAEWKCFGSVERNHLVCSALLERLIERCIPGTCHSKGDRYYRERTSAGIPLGLRSMTFGQIRGRSGDVFFTSGNYTLQYCGRSWAPYEKVAEVMTAG
jgi:hypothetical protein